MTVFLYIVSAICAYLITAVNPAILVSKTVYHSDIRKCGSKNPGFTNFKRTYGNKWAWFVLLFDLAKGAIVTAIFAQLFSADSLGWQFGAAYTGIFALLGHAYPIWHGFNGGKGFLVYLSVSYIIDWRAGAVATLIMLILLLTTKYMSLSTVLGLLSVPATLALTGADTAVTAISFCCVIYIALRHRKNFIRLVNGTENKFVLKNKIT